jgi:hypothetical protein
VWVARLFALLALGGAGVAIYYAIDSVEIKHEVTTEEAQDAMARLNTANRSLSGRLGGLKPGFSPKAAQESVRSAAALSRKLDQDVGTREGNLGDGVHAVLVAELAYLDAVGSTLNNPRSPLRGRIMELGITLRQQLQNIPGGQSKSVSGGAELVAFSKARVGE